MRRELEIDPDLTVVIRLALLSGKEENPGAAGREPASEQLGRARAGRLGEQRGDPTAHVAQLRRAPPEHGEHTANALRGPQEMRDGVDPLGKDVSAHARLVIQQRAFVGVRRGGAHARPKVRVYPLVAVAPFDYGGGGIQPEAGGVQQIGIGQDPHGAGPLEDREGGLQGTAQGVVEGNETWRFARAQKEVRERVGAVVEGPHRAGGCGNGHAGIITLESNVETEGRLMRSAFVVTGVLLITLASVAGGQEADSTRPDSAGGGGPARVDTAAPAAPSPSVAPATPLPPTLTPEQERYLKGLQRVGRGVAQLRVALDQATRSPASRDTASQRRAWRRLGGYCGTARVFMTGGRAQMQHLAYEDSTRLRAQRLARRVDDLIKYAPTCETDAGGATTRVSGELVKRLAAYDSALADFRAAIALPAGRDSGATGTVASPH